MLVQMPGRHLPRDGGPFAERRVLVVGRGPLGLFTALSLAQNGADVVQMAMDPLGEGVGFKVAAGLFEPVATEDPRAGRWTREGLDFCDWAVDDPEWGLERRKVLFMSDDPDAVRGGWLEQVGAVSASMGELAGRREHGAVFESFVMQPDLALTAFRRELGAFDIERRLSAEMVSRDRPFEWVDNVAKVAEQFKCDFFVLAPGLALGRFKDVGELLGEAAALSAGMGLTLAIAPELFDPPLEHVLMDFDDLGYLIPQRTRVIAGGTDDYLPHDDALAREGGHPMFNDEWEGQVRDKIEALWPGSGDMPGVVRVGPRPKRRTVLTHWSEDFVRPGFILSGAGGSGWTFAPGIAHDVCRHAADHFGGGGTPGALGSGEPLV